MPIRAGTGYVDSLNPATGAWPLSPHLLRFHHGVSNVWIRFLPVILPLINLVVYFSLHNLGRQPPSERLIKMILPLNGWVFQRTMPLKRALF